MVKSQHFFATWIVVWACTCSIACPVLAQPPTESKVDDPAIRVLLLDEDKSEREGQNGYQILLNRWAAERLRDILHDNVNEKEIAKAVAEHSDELKVKLLAHLVAARVTLFKKELADKIGPRGVLIEVRGPKPLDLLQKDRTEEERTKADRRDALIQSVLPRKWRAVHHVVNTVPTQVTVYPRNEDSQDK